jgi:hypothetical protein
MRHIVGLGVGLGAFVVLALACAGAAPAANLVVNPGFETLESYIGPWATTTGIWKGDVSQGVGAENGVTPIGNGMLKFVNTRWGPTYPNGGTGDLLQFIDLAPYASQIAGGQAKVRYAARFNRVADGGAGTVDTLFSVRLHARNGTLASFFNDASPQLASGEVTLLTDGDVATWQEASGVLAIPAAATHLAVTVRAFENVFNDVQNEFAGHYADEVIVEFVPEPGAGVLAGAALLLVVGRRRTRCATR